MPATDRSSFEDYQRVAAAIRFIEESLTQQPRVADIAAAAGLSVPHCVRLFRRWAGVSPKRFVQYLTVAHAKRLLDESSSVLEAALQSGLSGPSRLHDHFVTIEAITPGEYKLGGAGLEILYGRHASPFGDILLAVTRRGICGLAFCSAETMQSEVRRLRRNWPGASLQEDSGATAPLARQLQRPVRSSQPLSLLVHGTNFQVRIWEALLRWPAGSACSYAQLAAAAGRPGSARAAGAAVGANHIAWLIPCHRVIRSTGEIGQYRWGSTRKRAMLGWEAAHAARSSQARIAALT